MTAQIEDKFIYKSKWHSLVGLQGGELFSPEQCGMNPEMIDTSCYRGFYAVYKIKRNKLYLHELTVLEKDNNYLPICGKLPQESDNGIGATYKNLELEIPFTGKIRLARDFIEELYVHMGFQDATAYKTVYDLTIEKGKVIKLKDLSADLEKYRGKFKKRFDSDVSPKGIIDAFSLDIDNE